MAMTLANTIPGHLAALGKLLDIYELIRVQKREIILIYLCELRPVTNGVGKTYAKRDDVDLGNRENSWFPRDVVALHPEDHFCLSAGDGAWEEGQ